MQNLRNSIPQSHSGQDRSESVGMEELSSGHTTLACGITVNVERFDVGEPMEIPFEFGCSPLHFGYQLSGVTESSHQACGRSRRVLFSPGSNGIGYYPYTSGKLHYPGGESICAVVLLAPAEVLSRYFESRKRIASREMAHALAGKADVRFIRQGYDTPAKRILLRRILDGLHASGVGALFLESACLELVALQLDEYMKEASQGCPRSQTLADTDRERIHAARDLLVRDLVHPPTIMELARRVGINDFKLKQGFRAVFGTTVFGYFRNYRLEKAREYLEDGDMNVSEAASRIGYQNFGHFSKAFHERFGVRPKEYLQRHRRHRS